MPPLNPAGPTEVVGGVSAPGSATPHETADNIRHALSAGLDAAFTATTAQRARHPHTLGLSGLGGCRRLGAYRLAHTRPSDTPPTPQGRAANLGTWIHEGLLPALAAALGTARGPVRVELPVVLHACGLELPGHLDLLWGDVLLDLKTVREHRFAAAEAGPFTAARAQVYAYAVAARQAGITVRWVAWLYLDRASGDELIHVEAFNIATALGVIDRVTELLALSAHPDQAPRDERGPGLSYACDECPFLRRCWGATAQPGTVGGQRVVAPNTAAVAAALRLYVTARAERKKAEEDMEWARAVFTDASAPGTYGDLRWWASPERSEPDPYAALQTLTDAGLPVPYRVRSGNLNVRMAKSAHRQTKGHQPQ